VTLPGRLAFPESLSDYGWLTFWGPGQWNWKGSLKAKKLLPSGAFRDHALLFERLLKPSALLFLAAGAVRRFLAFTEGFALLFAALCGTSEDGAAVK
jgi:hypothetical protein